MENQTENVEHQVQDQQEQQQKQNQEEIQEDEKPQIEQEQKIEQKQEKETDQKEDKQVNEQQPSQKEDVKKLKNTQNSKDQKIQKKEKTQKQIDKEKVQCQYNDNQKLTQDAIKNGKKILVIEVCQNCAQHSYCTHHKEEKYNKYFQDIKQAIETKHTQFYVSKNYEIYCPTLGAFEIILNGKKVFSKLEKKRWPKVETIINLIQKQLECGDKENVTEKPVVQKDQQRENKQIGENQKVLNQFKFKKFLLVIFVWFGSKK